MTRRPCDGLSRCHARLPIIKEESAARTLSCPRPYGALWEGPTGLPHAGGRPVSRRRPFLPAPSHRVPRPGRPSHTHPARPGPGLPAPLTFRCDRRGSTRQSIPRSHCARGPATRRRRAAVAHGPAGRQVWKRQPRFQWSSDFFFFFFCQKCFKITCEN